VRTFVAAGGDRIFVIDETLERRWGRCIAKRGHDRDPLASRQPRSGATSGVRWTALTWGITPPGTRRSWALPVLSVPAPAPEVSRRWGLRPTTVPHRARQMILGRRRGWPRVELTVIGAQTYSVHERGGACGRRGVRLVAPLRLDAALHVPAPPREPGTHGRPRVKGERWPKLAQVLKEAQPPGQRGRLRWYNGRRRERDVTSGTAVWDSDGPARPAPPVGARARSQRAPRATRLRLDVPPCSATGDPPTGHSPLDHGNALRGEPDPFGPRNAAAVGGLGQRAPHALSVRALRGGSPAGQRAAAGWEGPSPTASLVRQGPRDVCRRVGCRASAYLGHVL
jgi:DDE superfamily endonuclease